MGRQEKKTWYDKLEHKVTIYKFYKFSLNIFPVLAASTLFILSLVFVDKLYMALAYLVMLLYYVITIINVLYDNRIYYGLFDLFSSVTCGVLALLAVLSSFNVVPWFQYILGIILTLIVVLCSSFSTTVIDTFDILDWSQKSNFVEGAIVFGIFLIILFIFPIIDIIKVSNYDELREQEYLAENKEQAKTAIKNRETEEKEIERVEALKSEDSNTTNGQKEDKESLDNVINPNDYIKDPRDNHKEKEQYSISLLDRTMKAANKNIEAIKKDLTGEKKSEKVITRPTSEYSEDYFDEDVSSTESSASESSARKHKEKK